MPTHPPQPTQPTPALTGQTTHAQANAQTLQELIGMAADVTRFLHARAAAAAAAPPSPAHPAAPDPLVTLAAAFDKAARTVRRCIHQAQRLAQPAPNPARTRTDARKRILREVEDAIGRKAHEGDGAESLQAELRERLDAPDLEDDLATRPIPDIVTEICRDLGLAAHPGTTPWKRRTPQDTATLHDRAAAQPSAPLSPSTPSPARTGPGPAARPPAPLPDDPAAAVLTLLRPYSRWHQPDTPAPSPWPPGT